MVLFFRRICSLIGVISLRCHNIPHLVLIIICKHVHPYEGSSNIYIYIQTLWIVWSRIYLINSSEKQMTPYIILIHRCWYFFFSVFETNFEQWIVITFYWVSVIIDVFIIMIFFYVGDIMLACMTKKGN